MIIEKNETGIFIDGRMGAEHWNDKVMFSMVLPDQRARVAVTLDQDAVDQLIDWLRPDLRQRAEQAEADRDELKAICASLTAYSVTGISDKPDVLADLRIIIDAMREWTQPPMVEYYATVRMDGILRQMEVQQA